MATSFIYVCFLLAIFYLSVAVKDEFEDHNRINAIKRCIADSNLPPFNTTKPYCPLTNNNLLDIVTNSRYQQLYNFGCDDLMRFADYIDQEGIELEQLSEIYLNNNTHWSWLSSAAYYCHISGLRKLCFDYGLCVTYNTTKMYTKEACEMDFLRLVAVKSNGQFSEKMYKYLMAWALRRSNFNVYYSDFNPAIPQHFLSYCNQNSETCVLSLLGHCFELEQVYFYHPYWCYDGVIKRLCKQFRGDERFRCEVVLETKLELSLENQCANEKNEGKCDNILTGIVDQKPISQLNTSDVDQIKSIVAGSAQRANHTNETLSKLNRIVDYFSLNESAVANVIDKQDATTFLSVINTLANENSTRNLAASDNNSSSNNSGAMLLHDLDEISKVIGLAVVSGNDKVDGKFNFNDENVGFFLGIGTTESENYTSGALKLNKTVDSTISNSSSSNIMTATISIPSSSVCNTDFIHDTESSGDDDDDMYFYEYPKICEGRPKCTKNINGIDYVYYDFFTIFGDCSMRLTIPNTCPSVIATSIADNIPSLLTNDLPSNMTVASLILSSQIITKDKNNHTSVLHRLRQNATLNFKLTKPMNSTIHFPACHFWDTNVMEWSSEGIETEIVSDDEVKCITNHLTSFAVLIDHRGLLQQENIPSVEQQALSIVGYIGPSFSVVCLLIAIIIMIMLRKQMKNDLLCCIHLNLCISLLLALIVLLVGLETADEIDWLCSIVAGLLHYLFLCVFSWMFVEGMTMFIMMMYVWGVKFLKWYIIVPLAWGIPLLIVGISAGIRYNLYGTNNFCWLSFEKGLMWAFLGPVVVISVINTIFLVFTVFKLIKVTRNKSKNNNKKSQNIETVKSAILGSIVLFPLLGTTWIIGIFAVSQKTTVFLWLFTIFNSLQGVFILVFHVLKHKAFLTWLARRCPCMDRFIEVHTSAEMSRRISTAGISVSGTSGSSRELMSAKYGIKAAVQKQDTLQIINEEEEPCDDVSDDISDDERRLSTI